VANRRLLRKVGRALEALENAPDAMQALELARQVREASEALESAHIAAARAGGATWTQIGAQYGLTKQGTQQRFGRREGRPPRRVSA
jgi:hypothetical protein